MEDNKGRHQPNQREVLDVLIISYVCVNPYLMHRFYDFNRGLCYFEGKKQQQQKNYFSLQINVLILAGNSRPFDNKVPGLVKRYRI